MNHEAAFLKKFTNVFSQVEQQMCLWDESQVHSDKLVLSLINLLEQVHACESAAFTCKPLVEFEDLKPRLYHKLIKSIENVMKGLSEDMTTFKAVSRRLSQYRIVCFKEYHKRADTLNLESLVEGCPDCPSVANLLEWITDMDTLYCKLYEEKQSILDRVSYDSSLKLQTTKALREWKINPSNWPRVKGFREQVAVLTAEGSFK